jgi:6-phosphogluconolactonase
MQYAVALFLDAPGKVCGANKEHGVITAQPFETAEALFDAVLHLVTPVLRNPGPTAVMVPGGRTPVPLFDALTSKPIVPGSGLHLGYTDERHVPETDPQSNYALTVAMIHALKLPPARVLKVRTELSLEDAAARYHETWRTFFFTGGTIRLALLGLGDDGHTCSLFTPEQVRSCDPDRYAAPVLRDTGPHRVTVTPALLQRVEHIIFLAAGQEKAAVVEAMFREPDTVTAALAVRDAPQVSLWHVR